jgi:hypothetical protein
VYSTCLFCNGPLGQNEAIEYIPVGRRLAYDLAMGRLWVVCRKCERWNLTPLEERWEAPRSFRTSTRWSAARAAMVTPRSRWFWMHRRALAGSLASLPIALRLALEMGAHEETERRALDGELWLLEEAWRDAKHIASVAADLLLPATVDEKLARLRRGRGEKR